METKTVYVSLENDYVESYKEKFSTWEQCSLEEAGVVAFDPSVSAFDKYDVETMFYEAAAASDNPYNVDIVWVDET